MTKVRAPLTFSLAISTAVGPLGWAEAARIVRRATRTVRHWAESDRKGTPTLDQALALDRAYMEGGGGFPPILASYARQLDVVLTPSAACRNLLADDIAAVSIETADAVSTALMVMKPGASPTAVHRAIAETEEASVGVTRLLGRLKSFLPSNSAERVTTGDH